MPHISIVLPTYNRVDWLPFAMESVRQQSYLDYELLLIDDASTDHTTSWVESFFDSLSPTERTRFHYQRLEQNQGVSAARNIGIQQSEGEWIAFLDSDDRWLPQKLEKQKETASLYPQYPVHFTDEVWIRDGKRVNPKKRHQKQEGWIFQPSLSLCLMAPSTIMIQRSVFEEVGGFDESLPVCEDYDLWLRITARYPVKLLNEALMIRYGGHEDQLSSRYWGMDRYRVQSLDQILSEVSLRHEDRLAAIAKLIEKCQILLQGFQKRGNMEAIKHYSDLMQRWS